MICMDIYDIFLIRAKFEIVEDILKHCNLVKNKICNVRKNYEIQKLAFKLA